MLIQDLKLKITQEWPSRRPELPFVWNRDWDRFLTDPKAYGRVKVILCADNPGVEEYKNSVYLAGTGRSGREARRWLANAGYDWDTEVLVTNKSPIHTPKTAQLKGLVDREFLEETERVMARALVTFLKETGAHFAWIVGMAGCDSREPGWPRPLKGTPDKFPTSIVLPHYFDELKRGAEPEVARRICISKHFSHGHFGVEIKEPFQQSGGDLAKALALLPHAHTLFGR